MYLIICIYYYHSLQSILEHKNGIEHRKNLLTYITHTKQDGNIDSELQMQFDKERNYWRELLKRVIASIKFLASRGLPFRGGNPTVGSVHNGNFLGVLEQISELDLFLKKHMDKVGKAGRRRGFLHFFSNIMRKLRVKKFLKKS